MAEMREKIEFNRGKRYLAKGLVGKAVAAFSRCLLANERGATSVQARCLYWLALALLRAGEKELAADAWKRARSLVATGKIKATYERRVNAYGMYRSSCQEMDDWLAFRKIQLERYLVSKKTDSFASQAERDAISDLLFDVWKQVQSTGRLKNMPCAAKLALFKAARPQIYVDIALEGRVLEGHFPPYQRNAHRSGSI